MYDKVILPAFKLFDNLDTVAQQEEKEEEGDKEEEVGKIIDLWGKKGKTIVLRIFLNMHRKSGTNIYLETNPNRALLL